MEAGDQEARVQLMELVYKNLHGAARFFLNRPMENPSLTPTTLVHEFFIKLSEKENAAFENRDEFFNYARNVMRSIISDYFKRRYTQKRGGGQHPLALDEFEEILVKAKADYPLLHEALEELQRLHPVSSAVVEYRFFFGFTHDQIAAFLETSRSTIRREWEFARAFIYQYITGHEK